MNILIDRGRLPTFVLTFLLSIYVRKKLRVTILHEKTLTDIDVKKLDYEFISEFCFWFKSVQKCNHNSTMKYLSNVKKIVLVCVKSRFLTTAPFTDFKFSRKTVERVALTEWELQKLSEKELGYDRLTAVRDIFLFSCYTGLSYADVEKLKNSEITTGVDNSLWIFTNRQKTNTPTRIPLLPEAASIIEKYRNNEKCLHSGQALPILSSDLDKLSVSVAFLNTLIYAKQLSQADRYAQEVKKMLSGIPSDNTTARIDAYNALASYYSEINHFKQAYHYAELYAVMAHKFNHMEDITVDEGRYYKLVKLNRNTKSVIGQFFKEQEIRDSAYNKVKAYQIFLLDMENESLEKNRHIDSLIIDAQLKAVKLKRNQLIQKVTFCGAVLLLIITGLIYSRYRLKQRSNALLTSQKEEIDHKNNILQQLIVDKNELLKDKDELLQEKELLFREVNHRVKKQPAVRHVIIGKPGSESRRRSF